MPLNCIESGFVCDGRKIPANFNTFITIFSIIWSLKKYSFFVAPNRANLGENISSFLSSKVKITYVYGKSVSKSSIFDQKRIK